jgi:hypothetical protein
MSSIALILLPALASVALLARAARERATLVLVGASAITTALAIMGAATSLTSRASSGASFAWTRLHGSS